MVGAACVRAFERRRHEVHAFYGSNQPNFEKTASVRSLDVTNREKVERLILDEWPDVVVNAAAISNPASVEADPQGAHAVNVAFPSQLALLTRHIGSRFIHLSTDMVFDGEQGDYRSTATPNPRNLYGQTKLLAEREILQNNPFDPVVLRITIVNGNSPGGRRSVHEKLLDAIHQGQRPRLFTDEWRQPCSAGNVAEVALELSERRDLTGIFHWGGAEKVTRHQLGLAILRRFGLPEDTIEPIQQTELPDGEARPAKLTLNLKPLSDKLKTRPSSLTEQMEELTPPAHLYRWIRSEGRV